MGRPFAPHIITPDSALGGLDIRRSLRFDPNANLTRTSSSTSNTFTYSVWIKRCRFSGFQYFFSMGGKGFAFHTSNNTLYLYDGTNLNESTARFRDPSAWYNIVVQINSGTATSYVNNVLTHNAVGGGAFTLTTGSNQTRIGSYDADYYFHGYMAEIHLVDGSVLAPSSFGFTDSQTGIWRPKKFDRKGPNNGTTWSGNVTSSNYASGSATNVFDGNFYGSSATINSSDASNNHITLSSVNVVASKVGVVLSNSSSDIQVYVNGSLVGTAAGGNIINNVSKLFEFTFTETTVSTIKVQRGSSTSGWQIYGVSLNGVPLIDGDTNNVGLNGFHLPFTDNSGVTATTIGRDHSGNGNNFTPNNFSVSAGVGNDSLLDSPSNNFATINVLSGYSSDFLIATNGNLDFSLANNRYAICSHIIPTSGKWYAECVWTDVQTGDIGVFNPTRMEDNSQSFDGRWNGIVMKNNGYIRIDNTQVQSGLTSITAGAIIGILIDRDAGTVSFTINGTANGTPILLSTMHFQDGGFTIRAGRNSSSGSNPTGSFNFGQRPFSYLPSGYRSLCDKNMTTPTGASIVRPQKHFEPVLYTGDNTEYRKIPLEFKADFLWFKRRDGTTAHVLSDSVTGITKHLITNTTAAQTTPGYPYASSVQDNGIILRGGSSSGGNISGRSMVAWCWKAGGSSNTFNVDGKGYATAAAAGITDGTLALTGASVNTKNGFSITTYVGTGSAGTIAHGLGKKPTFWIMKNISAISDWYIYYTINNGSLDYFKFTTDSASNSGADLPTTTTVSATSSLSTSGHTWVIYAWTDIPGYSKAGVYKGNGDGNGPYIPLGFRPAFVIMKEINDDGTNWVLYDNKRNTTNPVNLSLYPNLNNAEGDASLDYDFLSDGFKVRTNNAGINANGDTYLYMAFAEQAGFVPYMAPTNAR